MKKFLILLLLFFLIFYDAFTYAHIIQNEISENVIRLHVVANSDTYIDQELKLKVRDSILKFMKKKNYESYEIAYTSVSNSLNEIEKTAEETLLKNGYNYNVQVELDNFYFPQKDYNNLSFPSGMYNALKVTIGTGEGQNWWCVMYPTLCFSDSICSSNEANLNLKQSLSKESFSIIAKQSKFKFKIVDFFNKIVD